MSAEATRRRTPPLVVWLAFGMPIALALACVALVFVAWYQADQVQLLQNEAEQLRVERQSMASSLDALQGTATAMEHRLSVLEANDPAQQLEALRAAVENADDSDELSQVRLSLVEVQSTVDGFQGALDDLSSQIESLSPVYDSQASYGLPAEARLVVERQKQSRNLSCESSAASMVAQYHGTDLAEADALAALPLNDNPHLGFRGDVDGPTGGIQDYGVYAGPVVDLLNAQGLRSWPIAGAADSIRAAIARGNPVIAWVTYDCTISTPTIANIDGAEVTLVPNQHVVVVTGYNSDGVWANDPWDGGEDFYTYADLERCMGYFGGMAIEVAGP
jgi:uncharacterized protein YvpB